MARIVFANGTTYTIHASRLAGSSFALCHSDFLADPYGEADIVTIRPCFFHCERFNQYVNWLYKGNFSTSPPTELPPFLDIGTIAQEHFEYLKSLYLLGIRTKDSAFRDVVLDAFAAKIQEPRFAAILAIPKAEIIKDIYQQTSVGDKCRVLLVNVWAKQADPSDIRASKLPERFLADLSVAMMRAREPTPVETFECAYHNHSAFEACSASKKGKRT